jgi:cupin superfamily acireductone dioxygenase involved in methionine salvage
MAIKGKAGKSSSGASMSKYDVEVEDRLQVLESNNNDRITALENAVKELQSSKGNKNSDVPSVGGGSDKLDKLIVELNKRWGGF